MHIFLHPSLPAVSHRGVVFFRRQTNLTQPLLNKLASKISHASGKPTASKLHIHPLSKEFSESGAFIGGGGGGEKIDSEKDSEGRQISFKSEKSNFASAGWHTDISFEPIPSDYAMLQLRTLPKSGGDTMWSSMYAAYDLLSPHMKVFLEGLTATHDAEEFREQSAKWVAQHIYQNAHTDILSSTDTASLCTLKSADIPTIQVTVCVHRIRESRLPTLPQIDQALTVPSLFFPLLLLESSEQTPSLASRLSTSTNPSQSGSIN